MRIILASGSPRRFDLLTQMGWQVDVQSLPFAEAENVSDAKTQLKHLENHFAVSGESSADKNQDNSTPPVSSLFEAKDLALLSSYQNADIVCGYNALGKGKAAAAVTGTQLPVIAADTIVVLGDRILGKPSDTGEAKHMLQMLSGRAHQVKTAAALLYKDKTLLQVVTTTVHFRKLTDKEIDWYVGTGEPLDKAGAYGIQGKGAVLVEKIEGSYDNVVGLPLTTVYEMLLRCGAGEVTR